MTRSSLSHRASCRGALRIATALLVLAAARIARGDPGSPVLEAGAALVDITPPPGIPMAGYYHLRRSTGTHDPIRAKALVVGRGEARIALVALDLIATTREIVLAARERIERDTGIPGERVMISATHAHTGPMLRRPSAREAALGGDDEATVRYVEDLPDRIATAVSDALARLAPARVRAAIGHEPTLAFNRRFHMEGGGFGWNPGKLNPRILRPAGPIDPSVPVVVFESADAAATIATYVNYAMHLDTVGGLEISADYPATLARCLAPVRGEDAVTIFTIGCAGDINHIDVGWAAPQKGPAEAARIGTVLAGAVVETFPHLRDVDLAAPVLGRSEMLELPLPPLADGAVERAKLALERGADDRAVPFLELVEAYKVLDVAARGGRPQEVEVQVVALGRDVAWIGLPGEIFVELGLAIRSASPFATTIIAELANGSIGYVPTRQAYTQGQYEVITARVGPGAGEMLVETASRMLREVYAEAGAPPASP